jgi:hypothetical protein
MLFRLLYIRKSYIVELFVLELKDRKIIVSDSKISGTKSSVPAVQNSKSMRYRRGKL